MDDLKGKFVTMCLRLITTRNPTLYLGILYSTPVKSMNKCSDIGRHCSLQSFADDFANALSLYRYVSG